MWRHLKATDFINLIEGNELPAKRQTHLRSCARCTEAFVSAQNLHSKLAASAMNDDEMPEPDWFQFRADVRNSMLSRAAQRQSKGFSMTGWTNWLTRPAMSWGLAVAFTAGLSAGLLMWNHPPSISTSAVPHESSSAVTDAEQVVSLDRNEGASDEEALDFSSVNVGLMSIDQSNVFDQIPQLSDAQAERLQRLLEKNTGLLVEQ